MLEALIDPLFKTFVTKHPADPPVNVLGKLPVEPCLQAVIQTTYYDLSSFQHSKPH